MPNGEGSVVSKAFAVVVFISHYCAQYCTLLLAGVIRGLLYHA